MVCSKRSQRACQASARSFSELYKEVNDLTSFLQSDEEDSESDLDDEIIGEQGQEEYDPADSTDPYDKKQGEDSWIGRRVCKTFGELGQFIGIIYKARKDRNKKGHRLFAIYYFDDHSFEELWPTEIVKHLLPEDRDGLDLEARQKYDAIDGVVKSQWPKKKKQTKKKTGTKKKKQTAGTKEKKKPIWTKLPDGQRVYFLLDGETTGLLCVRSHCALVSKTLTPTLTFVQLASGIGTD